MGEMDVDVDLDAVREYATEAPQMLPSIARQTLLASYCLSVVALAKQLHAALLKARRDRDKEARIAQDWFERHSAAEAERDRARATAVAMESMLAETKATLNAANAELMALNQQLCRKLAECQRQLEAAREALAFYANPSTYHIQHVPLRANRPIWDDMGDRARAALAPTGQPEPATLPVHLFNLGLFRSGLFRLHSGQESSFKIDCDALSAGDWQAIAAVISQGVRFGRVVGIPTGGLKLAKALEPFATYGPVLLVDDVLTTGASMEEARREHPDAIGVVLFARGSCPGWVRPVFGMWPSPPLSDLERAVVEAVRKLPEPSYVDRHGRIVCCYCHAVVVLGSHQSGCQWLRLVDAFALLKAREEGRDATDR